jgi:hypothetical protein
MSRYRVGVVFEYDPNGEHDFLFEDMDKKEMMAEMIRLASEDISSGHGSVEILEIVNE